MVYLDFEIFGQLDGELTKIQTSHALGVEPDEKDVEYNILKEYIISLIDHYLTVIAVEVEGRDWKPVTSSFATVWNSDECNSGRIYHMLAIEDITRAVQAKLLQDCYKED